MSGVFGGGFPAFSGRLLHMRDEKSAVSSSGTFTAGFQMRDLNTVVTNEIPGASLLSNQFTLPAGEYFALGVAPAYQVASHRAQITDAGNTYNALVGTMGQAAAGVAATTHSFVIGRFSLAAADTLYLRHWCSTTRLTNGFGESGNDAAGGVNVFAELCLWKVG